MEGRDSPGPFSESFCVPVAICGQKGLLTLGRKCRTWAREAGSTLAGCGGKAARRADRLVGMRVLLHPYARLPGVEYAKANKRPTIRQHRLWV